MHPPIPDPAERPQPSTGDPAALPVAPTGGQAATPAPAQPSDGEAAPAGAPGAVADQAAYGMPAERPAVAEQAAYALPTDAPGAEGHAVDGAQPGTPAQTAQPAGAPEPTAVPAPAVGVPGSPPEPGCGPAVDALMQQQRPVFPPPVPATPDRGPRPPAVTTALVLQYVTAALLLLVVGLIVWEAVSYNALITEAASVPGALQGDVSEERAANWGFSAVPAALLLLLAGWQVTNTLLMSRGNNVARILGLVGLAVPAAVGTLGLCGSAFMAIGFGGYSEEVSSGDPFADGTFPEDFEGTLPDLDSYYHEDAFYARLNDLAAERNTIVLDVGMPLLIIVAIFLMITAFVLLVVPVTNRWFRPGHAQSRPWPPAFAGYGAPPPFPMPQYPVRHRPVPPFTPQPYAPPQPPYAPPPQPWAQSQQQFVPPQQPWAPPQQQFPVPQHPVQPPPIPPGNGPQH